MAHSRRLRDYSQASGAQVSSSTLSFYAWAAYWHLVPTTYCAPCAAESA